MSDPSDADAPRGSAAPDAAERRLVRRLKQGDDRAFEELVLTYQDRVYSLVLRMLGDRQDAEDVAQDVFFSVYRAIGRFRGDSRLYTWIYRIAINACKNRRRYVRGRHLDKQESIDEAKLPREGLVGQVPSPEAVAQGNRLQQAIARELAQLNPDHRQVLVLRDIQGLSYEDICRITGLAAGTVKSRLHRARIALKTRLGDDLEGLS